MRQFLIVLLSYLCLGSSYADNRTTLYDFRFWTSPERTRIVIDVEKGVRFSIKKDKKKVTLALKMQNYLTVLTINYSLKISALKKLTLGVTKIRCYFYLKP